MFNVSTRKVGGLRFIKLGRFTLSFSVSRAYRPLKGTPAWYAQQRQARAENRSRIYAALRGEA